MHMIGLQKRKISVGVWTEWKFLYVLYVEFCWGFRFDM